MLRQPTARSGRSDANPSVLLDHLALDLAHVNKAERETSIGTRPSCISISILKFQSIA